MTDGRFARTDNNSSPVSNVSMKEASEVGYTYIIMMLIENTLENCMRNE